MKTSARLPALLFLLLLIVTALPLLDRAVALAPLYLNPVVRSRAATALQKVTEERGWILSDVEITGATRSSLRLVHGEHLRGPADPQCFTLTFITAALTPCAD